MYLITNSYRSPNITKSTRRSPISGYTLSSYVTVFSACIFTLLYCDTVLLQFES